MGRTAGEITFGPAADPTVSANVRAGLARITATRNDGFDPAYEFTRTDAADLARGLQTAFVWAETEEGHGFWSDIWARLRAIARTAPKGPGLPWVGDRKQPEAAGGMREVLGFGAEGWK